MLTAADVQPTPATAVTPPTEKPSAESASSEAKAVFRDVDLEAEPIKYRKVFHFSYESVADNKLYEGQFTCKRLALGDLSEMGVDKARRNGGENVDRWIDFLHEMLAYLGVALIEKPEWWKPEESYDLDLLRQVYDYVRQWENTFRRGSMAK